MSSEQAKWRRPTAEVVSSLNSPLIGNSTPTNGGGLSKSSCLVLPTPFSRRNHRHSPSTATTATTKTTTDGSGGGSRAEASQSSRQRRRRRRPLGRPTNGASTLDLSDDDDHVEQRRSSHTTSGTPRGGTSSRLVWGRANNNNNNNSSNNSSPRDAGGRSRWIQPPPPSRIGPNSQQQQQQQQPVDSDDEMEEQQKPTLLQLLTPPPTQDRSERRRYETSLRNSPLYHSAAAAGRVSSTTTTPTASAAATAAATTPRRRRGLYDGELEPEGIRGQEAMAPTAMGPQPAGMGGSRHSHPSPASAAAAATAPPLRLLPLVSPYTSTRTTPTSITSSMHSVPEVSHESSSYDEASIEQQQQQHQQQPLHLSNLFGQQRGPTVTATPQSRIPRPPPQSEPPPPPPSSLQHPPTQPSPRTTLPTLRQQQQQQQPSSEPRLRVSRLQAPPPSRLPPPAAARLQTVDGPTPSVRRSMVPAVPLSTTTTSNSATVSQRALHRFHSDGESTCSDDDIDNMMADFLRPIPNSHAQQSPVTPNILHSPSAVLMNEQAAAIAAANTTARRYPLGDGSSTRQETGPRTLTGAGTYQHTATNENDIPRIRSALSSEGGVSTLPRTFSVGSSGFSSAVGTTSSTGRNVRSEVLSEATTVPMGVKSRVANAETGPSVGSTGSNTKRSSGGLSSTTEASIEQWQAEASAAVQRGDYDTALAAFTAVLQAQVHRHGGMTTPGGKRTPHVAVAAAYHNLGTVHAKRAAAHSNKASIDAHGELVIAHDRAAALECFQAAARCARDATPADAASPHPNVAVSLVRVGFLLLQAKQYQNAIITFTEALRIRLSVYGTRHALSANLYNNLGVCCLHMGNYARGLEHLQQALDIQRHLVQECIAGRPASKTASDNEDLLTVHQLELADTLFNIGGLSLEWMRRQGPDSRRSDQAVTAFQECLQLRTMILGKGDPRTSQAAALWTTAKALPRPRRLVPLPLATNSARTSSNWKQSHSSDDAMAPRHVSEPPQVRRSTQLNAVPPLDDTFPHSLSPIRSNAMSSPQNMQPQPVEVSSSSLFQSGEISNESSSIFRVGSTNNQSPLRPHSDKYPLSGVNGNRGDLNDKHSEQDERSTPMLQITISREDIDDEDDNDMTEPTPGTRVFVAPQRLTPGSKSTLINRRFPHPSVNESGDAVANELSHIRDEFEVDSSAEDAIVSQVDRSNGRQHTTGLKPQFSSSYDAEENCLISDSGVDSNIGRIHYPLAWSRAGIQTNVGQPSPRRRDIMVARPTISSRTHAHRSGASVPSIEAKNFVRVDSVSSEKWRSETVNVSTGNPARDELLAKARAMLLAHAPSSEREDKPLSPEKKSEARTATVEEQDLMEDGIAALGGNWGEKSTGEEPTPLREMLRDPMKHLRAIHDEATRMLKENNVVDAQRLFEVVLECQRHRHGPLHPDVASALHNLGITQLRAQNYAEALKLFEEAGRVRKGSLGKDHALVAVSLVKVGITLLLLHRFEEALWSFREALSVRKHALGDLHPSTARIYNNIGCVYVEFNELKEARRAFEAALDIQRSALCNDAENFPLMFATATTLCNLGYLYRYRDMHAKAATVLKEAAGLQETVLGPTHATALSTIDNLADSYANSGNATDALRYYNTVLGRFKSGGEIDLDIGSKRQFRAEAVLLYKMSRVHRQQKNRGDQLNCLKLALQAIRQYSDSICDGFQQRTDTLERRIHYDIRACREELEKEELKRL